MKALRLPGCKLCALLLLIALIAAITMATQRYLPKPATASEPFTASLLPSIRRASAMVPGDLPQSLGVLVLSRFSEPAASLIEGAAEEPTPVVGAVFQIRYPRGWIMVDAGAGSEWDPAVTKDAYARLQEALRGAHLIVFTHEHLDHVAGVVRSPYRAELERNVLFTRHQLAPLISGYSGELVQLEKDVAARFATVDYAPLIPIAPGVVLVKAAGHTQGSQLVYARLQSGTEVILAGDVSYLLSAVEEQRQKPPRRDLNEDRAAIASQMKWLREVSHQGVFVLPSHDGAALSALIEKGIVNAKVDLSSDAPVKRSGTR